MDQDDIEAIVVAALRQSGLNPHRAAVGAGLPADAIRHLLDGHEPKAGRLAEICRALGLEFYVGPPRDEPVAASPEAAEAADSERIGSPAEAVRQELVSILQAEAQTIRQEICEGVRRELAGIPRLSPAASDLEDAGALVQLGDGFGSSQETRQVEVVQYSAAAGGGAEEAEERVVGTLAFCRQWMDRHALRPGNCAVIDVRGESMEPTLWNGASTLFDRSRDEWRPGDIFVIRIPDQGLAVKRAGEDEAGNWVLVSDHPSWEPEPCPDDAEIVGQVVWTARTLIGQ